MAISPSSSPPLPPPPSQAQSNRGSAAPHHFETVLASPGSVSGPRSSPKSSRAKRPSTTLSTPASTPGSIPGDHATTRNLQQNTPQHQPVIRRKRGALRRWMARLLLLYLGYTFLFVCPNQKSSSQVCDAIAHVQDWLRPYTEPVAVRIDETYRTYGEPLVDQYGRPFYQQSQQYYVDYAVPAFKTASVKAKDSYHQYAHPHVVKAYDALYTDDVKARVHRAQTGWHHYQKQAHAQLEFAKMKAQQAHDQAWQLHAAHVQPVVEKVSPHAKVAWEKASLGANRVYDSVTVLYMTHVNPYAQESWIHIREAADQARDVVTQKADEIWGTSLHKGASHKAKKARGKAHEESLKDTLLKKASEAQKAAGEYSETIKAAMLGDKDKKAKDFKAATAEKGHDAQKLANDKVHEAGKVSDKIKKTVMDKAHEAQEAMARQAESIKHSVIDAVHGAEQAVEHEVEYLQKVAADKKKVFEKSAKQEANAIKLAAEKKKKEADKALKDASDQAHKSYKAAEHEAETIKAKVVKSSNDVEKDARKHVKDATKAAEGVRHSVEDTFKHAQEAAQDDAEWIKESAQQVFKDASKAATDAGHTAEHHVKVAQNAAQDAADGARKHTQDAKHVVQDQVHQAQEAVYKGMDSAGQIVMSGKDKVDEKIKGASVKVEKAKDAATHKAHDAHTASKVALAAMLASIEKTFNQFYHYEETETENLWNKLQSAIDEHIASAKKSAQELEKANKETYQSFEGYVKSWTGEAGDLEEKLVKLGQQQVDSIKKIGQRTETQQGSGKSKAQTLTNNVDVYITGLRNFLSERLAASKETVVSELGVFKDTSSEDDEHQAAEKLAALEQLARDKLKTAGTDARDKAHELLKQIEEIWAQSEAKSKEYVQQTRDLAVTAGEEAKVAVQGVKEKAKGKAKGVDETEPDVRVAPEEPGSGHRHHRH
ncbi:hypothetical protein CPC16_008889 [Podila verticillata]|nr:hypothetical protein CPC16_008889 [Podila verticillata]